LFGLVLNEIVAPSGVERSVVAAGVEEVMRRNAVLDHLPDGVVYLIVVEPESIRLVTVM
jgi:hypothetical protein